MANEDFKKVIVKDVELKFPRLGETFRFNTAERKSEPCQPTANGAAWTINWVMSADDAKALYNDLKAHYEARRAAGKVKAGFTSVFGMKKLEDGTVEFRAKRNGTKGNGEVNKPPMVIDGQKKPLEDPNIWSGSVGTIRAWAAPVTDPDGNGGISMFFDAVQVTEAIYGGGGLDDFDEITVDQEGPADDPFGDDAASQPKQAEKTASADWDEIPF